MNEHLRKLEEVEQEAMDRLNTHALRLNKHDLDIQDLRAEINGLRLVMGHMATELTKLRHPDFKSVVDL